MAEARQFSPGIHQVFISSTQLDLREHRQAVHDIPERMGQFAVDMAQFGAQGNKGQCFGQLRATAPGGSNRLPAC